MEIVIKLLNGEAPTFDRRSNFYRYEYSVRIIDGTGNALWELETPVDVNKGDSMNEKDREDIAKCRLKGLFSHIATQI